MMDKLKTVYHAHTLYAEGRGILSTNNICFYEKAGPSCSKLTTSLVNDSLKFKSSDTQIC